MRLVVYRLRPVPWLALVGASVAWLALVEFLTPALAGSDAVYRLLKSCSIIVGLGGAFIVSSEIDPAEPVLRSTPNPYWHASRLRMAVWLVVGTGLLILLIRFLPRTVGIAEPGVLWQALLPEFLLTVSLSFLGATIAGSYVGGGLSLGVVALLFVVSSRWHRVPFRLLEAPPVRGASSGELQHWYGGRLWTLALAIVFLTAPPLARRAVLVFRRLRLQPA